MLRLQRPTRPADYPDKAARVTEDVCLTFAKNGRLIAKDFDATFWSEYKEAFLNAQTRRCAYCDVLLKRTHGTIEHYRPKTLCKKLWRGQTGNTWRTGYNGPGYWWLAYDWDNWLYVCEVCNKAKGSRFPVGNGWHTAPIGTDDNALLLHPFEDDPSEHLMVNDLGAIEGISTRGSATTFAYDLNKDTVLVLERSSITRKALAAVERFRAAVGPPSTRPTDAELVEAAQTLRVMGTRAQEYAGIVRIIFRQQLLMSWESFFEPNE